MATKKSLKTRDNVARAVAELGGLSGGGRHHQRDLDVAKGRRRRGKHLKRPDDSDA